MEDRVGGNFHHNVRMFGSSMAFEVGLRKVFGVTPLAMEA